MEKYKTIIDFNQSVGIIPIFDSVVTAIPQFFSIILFVLFVFSAGSSYFIILKTTGRKRFWQSLTGSSFFMFLLSLVIAMQNTATITYLAGYWVGFYIMMVLVSWFMVTNYK